MDINFAIPAFPQASVTISSANILEQEGVKVIHCSRAFDTHESVVRGSSVFGQLLESCRENNVDVDGQIDAWLKQIENRGVYKDNLPHRKKVFCTGELCPVVTHRGVVCLAGFCTTTNAFMSETVTLTDYMTYWKNIWYNLSRLTIDKQQVCVTIPGGRIINISGCTFDLEQSLGIILITYFKHIKQFATAIPHLQICIGEEGFSQLNTNLWQHDFISYLYNFANLPINLAALPTFQPSSPKRENAAPSPLPEISAFEKLIADLKEMFDTLAGHNGESIEQFEGSKRVSVVVEVNKQGLYSILEQLRNHPDIERYFGREKGSTYDRNSLFILLGILTDKTNCFGKLNRRSVVSLCLDSGNSHRWDHLGGNTDNIITYVGQRMTKFKNDNPKLFNNIISSIPTPYISKA